MSAPIAPGKIFNVDEPVGKDVSALGTTAAEAELSAPDRTTAFVVSENAKLEQDAAAQAASVAKTFGSDFTGEPTTAAGKFHEDASRTTNSAVAEGKHDVDQATAVGAGYVDQAKALAGTAVETAQAYLPTALGGKPGAPTTTDPNAPGLVTQIKDTAVNAYATGVNAYTTAATVAQPHVETLKGAAQYTLETAQPHINRAAGAAASVAQPHIEKAKGVAAGYLGTAGTSTAQPTETPTSVPASTAPLESGKHTVDTPYATTNATVIASTEEPAIHN